MIEIDRELFRDMVKFYGAAFQLPPLAAKIYAYLIFDFERRGASFDQFVDIFAASKSSVSSNLNLLLNLNIISDFSKIDERKRFFVLNEKYMRIRFEEIIEKMQRESEILHQLKEFRGPMSAEELRRFEVYSNLFKKSISHIRETLEDL